MTPKWPSTVKGQRYPAYILQLPPSHNIHCFTLWLAAFELQAILRQVPNDPQKWPWKRSKVLYKNTTTTTPTSESQISLPLALRRAVFKIQAILRDKYAPNDLKITMKSKRSKVPYLRVSKFHSSSLYGSCRPIWDKCTKCFQMTLNTKRSKVPHLHVATTPKS